MRSKDATVVSLQYQKMISLVKRYRVELIVFALLSIFYLPFCGMLFGCGCSHLWTTDLKHCNIHNPAPPNCPWCSGPLAVQLIPFAATILAAFSTTLVLVRKGYENFFVRLVAGLTVALITAFLMAWIYSRAFHYPHFLS